MVRNISELRLPAFTLVEILCSLSHDSNFSGGIKFVNLNNTSEFALWEELRKGLTVTKCYQRTIEFPPHEIYRLGSEINC